MSQSAALVPLVVGAPIGFELPSDSLTIGLLIAEIDAFKPNLTYDVGAEGFNAPVEYCVPSVDSRTATAIASFAKASNSRVTMP